VFGLHRLKRFCRSPLAGTSGKKSNLHMQSTPSPPRKQENSYTEFSGNGSSPLSVPRPAQADQSTKGQLVPSWTSFLIDKFHGRVDYMATLTIDMKRWNKPIPERPACGRGHGATRWRPEMTDLPPERTYKAFHYFVQTLNDRLFGRHWERRKQGVRYAVARELQRRGTTHFHALLSHDGSEWLDYGWAWHTWNGIMGSSDFQRPCSQGDVCRYIAKYVTKGYDGQVNGQRSGEIELSEPWTWESFPQASPLPLEAGN